MRPYQPMMHVYDNAAIEAELAYRRERLMAAGRGTRTRRGAWFRNRRQPS